MFSEGASLEALESVDSRRYLPHALIATVAVIVAPALAVIPLSPFSGVPDLLLSALLAIGLSAAAGSIGAALWGRRADSREMAPPGPPTSAPSSILAPVLDRVDEILDPLPTEQLTDPLKGLLGGGGSAP